MRRGECERQRRQAKSRRRTAEVGLRLNEAAEMAHQNACRVENGVQGTRAASLRPIGAQVVEAEGERQRQQAKRRRIEAERREVQNEEDEGGRQTALVLCSAAYARAH